MIQPAPVGSKRPWRLLAAATVALAAMAGVPVAHADGDPASDVLLFRNVYLPSQPPSPAVGAALELAAGSVYAQADRVKVAVIYEPADLGAIPSLFGKPADYAKFLGIELGRWYMGPVLVVMPTGFGIYDGGRATAAEDAVLASVPISSGSPDDLVRSATVAVQRLAAAGALSSADVRRPLVTARPAVGKRGKLAALHFAVFDDSGRSASRVRVYDESSLLATLTSPPEFKIGTRDVELRWLVPVRLRSRQLRFCVVASDPSGNHSAPTCAPFLRLS